MFDKVRVIGRQVRVVVRQDRPVIGGPKAKDSGKARRPDGGQCQGGSRQPRARADPAGSG